MQYGFTKIRRGPDVDMYAHPSFVRDTPETLLQLRKITNGSRNTAAASTKRTQDVKYSSSSRTVSPLHHDVVETPPSPTMYPKIIVPKVGHWGRTIPLSTAYTSTVAASPVLAPAVPKADRGKLDLLAMALEQQAAH